MKKLLWVILALLLAAGVYAAGAEEGMAVLKISGGTFQAALDAEEIDLGSIALSDTDADYGALKAFLRQLTQLKKVDMFSTRIKRPRIEELAKAFPSLEFGWTMVVPCSNPPHPERTPHLIRTDITAYSTLHNNKCTQHTARDLSILRYCKNLLALDIGHNRVDDLSFLYDLPHLKVLIVACNSDLSDITPIGSLKELEYLEIFKNNIRDISCLANCENLVDLNICFNRISDWSPLYGLKKLRRLWLYNSNNYSDSSPVPSSAVQALRKALPECKVDAVSYSTEGCGRQHPRYDTINTMFWGTEYIPFPTLD